MYNPLKQFKIIDKVKKEQEAKKKGFKAPPSMPTSASPIDKMKNLKKNPGK
jgi:hypothetical protein